MRRTYTPLELISVVDSCRTIFSSFPEGMGHHLRNVDMMILTCVIAQVDPPLLAQEAKEFAEWKEQILDADDAERDARRAG